jgi:hypothetical protein
MYWFNGDTFYAGGEDIYNSTTAVVEQGNTSVVRGNVICGWTENKYNGLVLTEQTSDANAKNAGELVSLRSNGTWEAADANTANSTSLLGICLSTVGANETIQVLLEGIYSTVYHDQLGTSSPGVPLYISVNAGSVTETAPTATNDYVRLIGHNICDSSDKVIIRFDPDNTWIKL